MRREADCGKGTRCDPVSEIEQYIYMVLLTGGLLLAPVVFAVLLWIPAPYGRYARCGWGPEISRRAG